MSELTSNDDEETVNFASATIILVVMRFCSVLREKGVILCGFKAARSLENTGLSPLAFVRSDGV